MITLFETNCGPTVKARARLEPEGTWDACRRDLVAVAEEIGEDDDGGLLVRAEYLVRVGTKAD